MLKLSNLIIIATICLLAISCNSTTTNPTEVPSATQTEATSLSKLENNLQDLPFSFVLNTCFELVDISGSFHLVETRNNSDHKDLYNAHVNASGTGIGRTTGNEYDYRENVNVTRVWDDDAGWPRVLARTFNGQLIGRGNLPDWKFHQNFKVIWNADGGAPTVTFNDVNHKCD